MILPPVWCNYKGMSHYLVGMKTSSKGKSKGSSKNVLSSCHVQGITLHPTKVIALKGQCLGL